MTEWQKKNMKKKLREKPTTQIERIFVFICKMKGKTAANNVVNCKIKREAKLVS